MFKAINELQSRNSRNKNRKQRFEDIHIVAKQLRPYVVNLGSLSLFENKKSISKTYYNLIEYGEVMLNLLKNDYEKCLSKFENISPETPLVKIIYDLEQQISEAYAEVDLSYYEINKSIVVKEWINVFNSGLYSFDFGLVYSDINENIKIGILKCFQKVLDYFGYYYVLNEDFIDRFLACNLEGELDYIKEDGYYENNQKLFEKDSGKSFKKIRKAVKDLKKILLKDFDKNQKYENEDLQELHNNISYILDFDMNVICALREENNYNDVMSFEMMFIPSFKVDEFSNKLFDLMEKSILEQLNSFGVELLCTYHTATKDTFKTHAEEIINDMMVFQDNLNEIMYYINKIKW